MNIRIYVNNEDVSEWITSLSTNISFEENKLIGNTPAMEMSLEADNRDGKFNMLLDFPFLMKDEQGNLLGTFDVYEKPERMTKSLSLTLYDRMVNANEEYVSELEYPVSVTDILNEIGSKLGSSIDATMLDEQVKNKQVDFYDSSETMRTHLGWIAEAGGCNMMAKADGSYCFVPLSKDVDHIVSSEDIEKFETIEDYMLSGVKIDNGLTPILSGTEEGHVYLLNEENPYIDKQSDVDLIYGKMTGLSFKSVRDMRLCAIDDLRCGEMVSHEGYFNFLVLNLSTTYLNASYDIQEVSGEMSTKNGSKTNVIHSTKNKIRRIESMLDQNEAKLQVLAQDMEESDGKIGELLLNAEQFKTELTAMKTDMDNTIAVTVIKSEYGLSDNEETSPIEWSEGLPASIEASHYLWIREAVTYSSGLTMYQHTRILCQKTNDKSVSSVTRYYVMNESEDAAPTSGWQTTIPSFHSDYFLWQKERIAFTDQTSTETEPFCMPLKTKFEEIDAQLNSLVSQISTAIIQLSSGVEINKTTIDSLGQSIEEWARFDGAELELGMTSSLFKARLSNSELAFWQGNTKVAWLSNNELHVASAVITTSIGVGALRLEDESNNGFSFMLN